MRTGEQRILQADIIVNAAGLWAQSIAHRFAGLPPATVPKLHVARGCYFELKGGQGVVTACPPAAARKSFVFPASAWRSHEVRTHSISEI